MSEGLKGVVVSHGVLGTALVDAVRRITGDEESLIAVSNEGCSRDSLGMRVAEAAGNGGCVLFVDLPGGSCLLAAARYQREHDATAVVAGVNLAMLLDFVHHRNVTPSEAAARAVNAGANAVKSIGG
jgi:mannose/fructose-specific phosphotransferase system component IIA